MAEIELLEALGQAWDDGNATGLDGYVGPNRGAGEVDPEAEAARERILVKLTSAPASVQVDREALVGALSDHRNDISDTWRNACICGALVTDWDEHRADAVLALLSPEEES